MGSGLSQGARLGALNGSGVFAFAGGDDRGAGVISCAKALFCSPSTQAAAIPPKSIHAAHPKSVRRIFFPPACSDAEHQCHDPPEIVSLPARRGPLSHALFLVLAQSHYSPIGIPVSYS